MIQPNEVRIGNYLQVSDGTIFKVKHILPNENAMRVSGIPITKELLVEKCGFEPLTGDLKYHCHLFINGTDKISLSNGSIYYGIKTMNDRYDFISLPHIKYLHQLQNLVFSLTGKELEIKM